MGHVSVALAKCASDTQGPDVLLIGLGSLGLPLTVGAPRTRSSYARRLRLLRATARSHHGQVIESTTCRHHQ
jgi:hypothetical protein